MIFHSYVSLPEGSTLLNLVAWSILISNLKAARVHRNIGKSERPETFFSGSVTVLRKLCQVRLLEIGWSFWKFTVNVWKKWQCKILSHFPTRRILCFTIFHIYLCQFSTIDSFWTPQHSIESGKNKIIFRSVGPKYGCTMPYKPIFSGDIPYIGLTYRPCIW